MAHAGSPGPESPTYANLPVSPSGRKQLHYLGLELQEASVGVRGAGASRYAQIDITAMETAHRVGAQHAQARQERLQERLRELEQQRRSGAPL